MTKCKACQLDCEGELIACVVCTGIFHMSKECTGLASTTEMRVIELKSRSKSLVFRCKECTENNGSSLVVTEALCEIQEKLKKLDENCSKIPGLVTEVDKLKDDVGKIKQSIGEVNVIDRLSIIDKELENIKIAATHPEGGAFDYLSEMEERIRRSHNIYFHNVEDDDNPDRDLSKVKKWIEDTLSIKVLITQARRIGKYKEGETRPLLIILKDADQVKLIMTKRKEFSSLRVNSEPEKKLNITTDKTYLQRQQLKKAIEEINKLKAEGKKDYRIRYINGKPTVLQDKTSRQRRGSHAD